MLDSNLPIYYFKPSTDQLRPFDIDLLFTQYDSDPEARYILRHPDPTKPIAKNVYAAAVLDAYIPDIVYGEVLIRPAWSQPTLSAEEIRRNGGIAPPPVPLVPQDFAIQLYNPEQQVVVLEKPASFASTPSYTFSVPQSTFRLPSASALDRSQSDPVADPTIPKLHFSWKREGKLTRDITCYLVGRSTDNASKKKGGKEPSVAIALLTNNYRDLQIYESNISRFELEDPKGFEVMLILSAAVIRDVYLGQRKDCFNVGEAPRKNSNNFGVLGRKKSSPAINLANGSQLPPAPTPEQMGISMSGANGTGGGAAIGQVRHDRRPSQPPPADPRAQWEIDNEAARLRAQQETERRWTEQMRKEQEKRDQEEAKRLQKQLDAESRERRKAAERQQADIDRETQRLRREYGDQTSLFPPLPPRPNRHSTGSTNQFHVPGAYPTSSSPPVTSRPYFPPSSGPIPTQNRPFHHHHQQPAQNHGPYLQQPGVNNPSASQSTFSLFGGSGSGSHANGQSLKPKRSFFGLRSSPADEGQQLQQQQRPPQKLVRKKSSHW